MGAESPPVSVLLPTHNRADVLPFAIRSILAQTLADFELLIVGDGCTDDTAAVVASFADPRIRWLDLPKAPHFGYANRNVALRGARGALVAYMAHDDLWLPDHLALLVPAFADPGVELAYTRPLWLEPDGLLVPGAFNLHNPAMRHTLLSRTWNHIPSPCIAHRRACLDRYGYWDETLAGGGDWDLWARIIAGGGEANIAYVPTPTALHFRAIWRTDRNAGPPELGVWRLLRDHPHLDFPTLALPTVAGLTQQEATWRDLAADPDGWVRRLRGRVDEALDWCVSRAEAIIAHEDRLRELADLTARHAEALRVQASDAAQFAALEREFRAQATYIVRIEGLPPVRLYRRLRQALMRSRIR